VRLSATLSLAQSLSGIGIMEMSMMSMMSMMSIIKEINAMSIMLLMSMMSIVLLGFVLRQLVRIYEMGEFMSHGLGGILTKLNYIEKRIDKSQGLFRDQIRHSAQTIEDFDSSLDKDWLMRWVRDEYESVINVSIVRGVNNSGMRTLWMILLSAAVSKVRYAALSYKWSGDKENMNRLLKNIEMLRTIEYGNFYEDLDSVMQVKEAGETSWSVLHEISVSFFKQELEAYQNFHEMDKKAEEKKAVCLFLFSFSCCFCFLIQTNRQTHQQTNEQTNR
jgi:hypothetical protein